MPVARCVNGEAAHLTFMESTPALAMRHETAVPGGVSI
jgi:hypothetical protein